MSIAAKDQYGNIITSNTSMSGNSISVSGNPNLTFASHYTIRNSGLDDFLIMIDYIDFAFQIMGIDLTYQDFKNMSSDERKAFLRDIKINKLI
jgi:hypothetical protein